MPSYPSPAFRCLDLAAAAAPDMIDRAIAEAVAAMQQEEQKTPHVARRQELADAWFELQQRRSAWRERYPQLLRALQDAAAPAPIATAPARRQALSLVDDEALAQSLESSRLKQLLAPRLEQPLAELDALMSSALGLATVQPERNPLRPDIFAQSLRDLMHPASRPDWPGLWMKHLANPMAGELEKLYRQAVEVLREAKLQAASYRVLPAASPGPVQAAPQALPQPAPHGAGYAEPQGLAEPWQQRMAGPQGMAGPQAMAGPQGMAGPQAMAGPQGMAGPQRMPGPQGRAGPQGVAGPQAMPAAGLAPVIATAPSPAAGWPGGPGLGGPAWADLSHYRIEDELFQHFLFARSQPSQQGLAPAYYAQVDQQLATLAAAPEEPPFDPAVALQYRTLPPVERPHRAVGTGSALDEVVWGRWAPARERSLFRTQLKKEARQVGQVLGLEVVRKLVDQVARDPRLLAPVREAIVALEPSLLRLALVAPRFFSDEGHAGRRLVERVAERSFKYNDEFGGDFQQFFADVRLAFQALNGARIGDDQPFRQALEHLESRWTAQDELEAHGRQVAVDAVHFAEAREAEAGQIAWSISQRADLEGVPAVVQDFLYGRWSLVMAHARLAGGDRAGDPAGWTAVITDLLWSVKPQEALRDPARLIATIPGLLDRLRRGLDLLGQADSDNDSFFQTLEQLHRPVLKLRARSRHGLAAPVPVADLDPALLATSRQQPKRTDRDPWMAPGELKAAGFDESLVSQPAPLADEEPAAIDGLQQGCWVDLHANGEWRRATLTWVSSRGTLFMFVSSGGRPHSMTRRTLQRLLHERLVRPVEAGAVVQRALDQLSHPEPPHVLAA